MILIDQSSLTRAPVRPALYGQALMAGRAGTLHLVSPSRRDPILRAFSLAARNGAAPSHVVVAGPYDRSYWFHAPPGVTVTVDGVELPPKGRIEDVAAWMLSRAGMDRAEAKRLVAAPPKTDKAKGYRPLKLAQKAAERWSGQPVDDLQGLEVVGEANQSHPRSAPPSPAPSRADDRPIEPYLDKAERPFRYKDADNPITIAEVARQLESARSEKRKIGLDTEGTDESPHRAELTGIGLAFDEDHVYYLPMTTPDGPARWAGLVREMLNKYLPRLRWVATNGAGYDYIILKRHGFLIDRAELVGDSMLASYVYAQLPNEKGARGLKDTVSRFFDYLMTTFEQMLAIASEQTGQKVTDTSQVPVQIIAPYCCEDAYWHPIIESKMREMIVSSKGKLEIYTEVELPLSLILAEMELAGLPINLAQAEKWRDGWKRIVKRLLRAVVAAANEAGWKPRKEKFVSCPNHSRKRAEIAECSDCDEKGRIYPDPKFNPRSTQHIADVLQGCFNLPALAYSDKTTEPQNDEGKLLILRQMFEGRAEVVRFITALLDYKREYKLLSTYLEPFVRHAEPPHEEFYGHVIHASFNQIGTESSRLSSSDPINSQNIPPAPRVIFEAPKGYRLWGADYSQIELRIIAKVTECAAMIAAFREGRDVHSLTAWRVFGIPEEKARTDMNIRLRSKRLNFCVAYGGEADMVQELLTKDALKDPEMGIVVPTLTECREMTKEYRRAYPEIFAWKAWMVEEMRRRGYSETLYGHRRFLPDLNSPIHSLRARAERQGLNLVIQGTAGQIIKMAMLGIAGAMGQYGADIRNQVHDELWGTVRIGPSNEAWLGVVEECMVLDQPLRPVPLVVEPKLMENWGELK